MDTVAALRCSEVLVVQEQISRLKVKGGLLVRGGPAPRPGLLPERSSVGQSQNTAT
jgi:hypothetical protein